MIVALYVVVDESCLNVLCFWICCCKVFWVDVYVGCCAVVFVELIKMGCLCMG